MKRRPVVALALALLAVALSHCAPCPSCDSAQTKIGDAFNLAGYKVAKGLLGPLAGSPPLSACSAEACAEALSSGPPTPAPWAEDTAFQQPGACSKSYGDDTPCVTCVKAWCCSETFACLASESCTCHMAELLGTEWPEERPCGDGDQAFGAAFACLDDHCAEECYP